MVILRGKVPSIREETGCELAGTHEGSRVAANQSFIPQWVEIEQALESGYLLVTIDEKGCSFVETWHASVEEAKAEAKVEFSVDEDDWMPATGEE